MDLFVCYLRLQEKYHDMANWDANVQAAFTAHADFLNKNVKTGKITFVGRTDTALMQVFPFKLLVASDELKKWNKW